MMSDFMFGGGFEIMFGIVFISIFVMVIIGFARNIIQWGKNNNSPRLSVEASVVAKRTSVSHHHNSSNHTSSSSTWYYVTFQVASGDRMELPVRGMDYGMLAEGDVGILTFQGTRYLGFERM